MVVLVMVTLITIQKLLESSLTMLIEHFILGKNVFNVLESEACPNLKINFLNTDSENKNVVSIQGT